MLVTSPNIVIDVSPAQQENKPCSIRVTSYGIVIDVNPEQ